jgi:hypothetical protein
MHRANSISILAVSALSAHIAEGRALRTTIAEREGIPRYSGSMDVTFISAVDRCNLDVKSTTNLKKSTISRGAFPYPR